jgi:hypothetical protein
VEDICLKARQVFEGEAGSLFAGFYPALIRTDGEDKHISDYGIVTGIPELVSVVCFHFHGQISVGF